MEAPHMYLESNISQQLMRHSIHILQFHKEYKFNKMIFAWSTGVKQILRLLHITAKKWRRRVILNKYRHQQFVSDDQGRTAAKNPGTSQPKFESDAVYSLIN